MRYFIILIFFILNCKNNTTSNTKISITKSDKNKPIKTVKNLEIEFCSDSTKIDTTLYNVFINTKHSKSKKKLDGHFYYGSKKTKVDSLFMLQDIKCITSVSDKNYIIYDIYYEKISAENILKSIIKLNIEKKQEHINYYHNFFKRGLVLILRKKSNKLTLITYNPFINNSLPNKVKSYFKNSIQKYDKVVSIIGIGYLDILKN